MGMAVPLLHLLATILGEPHKIKKMSLSTQPNSNHKLTEKIHVDDKVYLFFKEMNKTKPIITTRPVEKVYPVFYKSKPKMKFKTDESTIHFSPFDRIEIKELEIQAIYKDTTFLPSLIRQKYITGDLKSKGGENEYRINIFVEIVPPSDYYESVEFYQNFQHEDNKLIHIKEQGDDFVVRIASNLFCQIIEEENVVVGFLDASVFDEKIKKKYEENKSKKKGKENKKNKKIENEEDRNLEEEVNNEIQKEGERREESQKKKTKDSEIDPTAEILEDVKFKKVDKQENADEIVDENGNVVTNEDEENQTDPTMKNERRIVPHRDFSDL